MINFGNFFSNENEPFYNFVNFLRNENGPILKIHFHNFAGMPPPWALGMVVSWAGMDPGNRWFRGPQKDGSPSGLGIDWP